MTTVEAEHGSEGSLNVRFAPKATESLRRRKMTRCANKGTHAVQQIALLFDQMVGAREQRLWDGEAERLGSLGV